MFPDRTGSTDMTELVPAMPQSMRGGSREGEWLA